MKILIAEDDRTSRTMLQHILTKWGYEVETTADGNQAWEALQAADSPQLAILDWMMPGMDGATLCRSLRDLQKEEPLYLILLTARNNRQDIVQGLEAGANDYISKPYDQEELQARIAVGCRMIELQAALREREKLQGVLEMARAVCHELNQPLQGVLGFSELVLLGMDQGDPKYETLNNIKVEVMRIAELTRKIMSIARYRTKPYAGKSMIVDIQQAMQS